MSTLYLAWRGVEDDQNLYWAVSFDGRYWSRQFVLSDRASADAPALAVFRDKLVMAWTGVGGDDNLYWATYDGNADLKWSDQSPATASPGVKDRASVEGPSLAVFQDKLFMAWRGVSGDQDLYWATYDGNPNLTWSKQNGLGDRASFDVPALGVFQDQLFMAWRGVEGDENLYWATYDDNDPRNWTDQRSLTDRGSTEGPALVAFNNKLYMVWKGVRGIDEDDERLYWATYDEADPRGWTDQTVMAGMTADKSNTYTVGSVHRPSLAVFQNRVFVAGAGPNTQSSIGLADRGDAQGLDGDSSHPAGPDDDPSHPAPIEPKGLFYSMFDGSAPVMPIIVFPDRASETPVAQAVYVDVPLSMRKVMTNHGFDPSKGTREFIQEFSLIKTLPVRALVGF
jgi:hypothetical protein